MNNNSIKNNNLVKNLMNILVPILFTILIAVMGWIFNNLMSANSEIKVLRAEVISLKEVMRNKTKDRYHRTDAVRDFNRVDTELRDIKVRL